MIDTRANTDIKLSVVIPCYNVADTISEQLEALSKQKWEHAWEVIVSDNGSSDNTKTIAKQFTAKISNLIIIDADKKKGAGYARNKGVENSIGEYIAFVDADDIVGKNWLRNLGNMLLTHDFVACRTEWSRLNNFNENTRGVMTHQTDGLLSFHLVKFMPFARGGTLGIKKSIHRKVGGFDENFISSSCEDNDYCWRVQLNGNKLTFISAAVIHIRARSTNADIFRQEMIYGEYEVYLHEKYKNQMPEITLKQNLKRTYYILRLYKCFFSKERKTDWIIRIGKRLGVLKGMIKYRYLKIRQ